MDVILENRMDLETHSCGMFLDRFQSIDILLMCVGPRSSMSIP